MFLSGGWNLIAWLFLLLTALNIGFTVMGEEMVLSPYVYIFLGALLMWFCMILLNERIKGGMFRPWLSISGTLLSGLGLLLMSAGFVILFLGDSFLPSAIQSAIIGQAIIPLAFLISSKRVRKSGFSIILLIFVLSFIPSAGSIPWWLILDYTDPNFAQSLLLIVFVRPVLILFVGIQGQFRWPSLLIFLIYEIGGWIIGLAILQTEGSFSTNGHYLSIILSSAVIFYFVIKHGVANVTSNRRVERGSGLDNLNHNRTTYFSYSLFGLLALSLALLMGSSDYLSKLSSVSTALFLLGVMTVGFDSIPAIEGGSLTTNSPLKRRVPLRPPNPPTVPENPPPSNVFEAVIIPDDAESEPGFLPDTGRRTREPFRPSPRGIRPRGGATHPSVTYEPLDTKIPILYDKYSEEQKKEIESLEKRYNITKWLLGRGKTGNHGNVIISALMDPKLPALWEEGAANLSEDAIAWGFHDNQILLVIADGVGSTRYPGHVGLWSRLLVKKIADQPWNNESPVEHLQQVLDSCAEIWQPFWNMFDEREKRKRARRGRVVSHNCSTLSVVNWDIGERRLDWLTMGDSPIFTLNRELSSEVWPPGYVHKGDLSTACLSSSGEFIGDPEYDTKEDSDIVAVLLTTDGLGDWIRPGEQNLQNRLNKIMQIIRDKDGIEGNNEEQVVPGYAFHALHELVKEGKGKDPSSFDDDDNYHDDDWSVLAAVSTELTNLIHRRD